MIRTCFLAFTVLAAAAAHAGPVTDPARCLSVMGQWKISQSIAGPCPIGMQITNYGRGTDGFMYTVESFLTSGLGVVGVWVIGKFTDDDGKRYQTSCSDQGLIRRLCQARLGHVSRE
jgi:hypothetical protein